MISCHEFYELLLNQNIDFFTGIPDSLLKDFNAYLLDNVPKSKLKILKEKEGPILLEVKVNSSSRKELGRPTTSSIKNKQDFMDFLSKN